jgi:hypothetical protein
LGQHLDRGIAELAAEHGFLLAELERLFHGHVEPVEVSDPRNHVFPAATRPRNAHTGFEPVLPENAEAKPNSRSRGRNAPSSDLKPHIRAVLERLTERSGAAISLGELLRTKSSEYEFLAE